MVLPPNHAKHRHQFFPPQQNNPSGPGGGHFPGRFFFSAPPPFSQQKSRVSTSQQGRVHFFVGQHFSIGIASPKHFVLFFFFGKGLPRQFFVRLKVGLFCWDGPIPGALAGCLPFFFLCARPFRSPLFAGTIMIFAWHPPGFPSFKLGDFPFFLTFPPPPIFPGRLSDFHDWTPLSCHSANLFRSFSRAVGGGGLLNSPQPIFSLPSCAILVGDHRRTVSNYGPLGPKALPFTSEGCLFFFWRFFFFGFFALPREMALEPVVADTFFDGARRCLLGLLSALTFFPSPGLRRTLRRAASPWRFPFSGFLALGARGVDEDPSSLPVGAVYPGATGRCAVLFFALSALFQLTLTTTSA